MKHFKYVDVVPVLYGYAERWRIKRLLRSWGTNLVIKRVYLGHDRFKKRWIGRGECEYVPTSRKGRHNHVPPGCGGVGREMEGDGTLTVVQYRVRRYLTAEPVRTFTPVQSTEVPQGRQLG